MSQVGYVRVSTVKQNNERQLDGVELDKVFTDEVSGSTVERDGLKACLEYLRDGDVLHVHSIDRLSRSITDLKDMVEKLNARGIAVKFHKNGLLFDGDDNATSKLLLNMLGAVAEFERDMMLERQAEGIAKAKAAGKYKGRKKKITPEMVREAVAAAGGNKTEAARVLGCTPKTIYRNLEDV